ncbi:MAG: 4-hydroxy-tetrahydrodipicolinate synthase [Actinobacteria bacterium]|nr:4-hydroxy-tetrahydrodipicolinate synthase [Actinomycetota bacterium]
MINLGEVITAMVTPFDKDYKIDWSATDKLIDYLLENGSDSLLFAGTTGESPTLSDDEKINLFKFGRKKLNNKNIKLIAGTGSNDTYHTIELSKKAEDAGADALLVVTPYYNKPTQTGLINHFEAVANAVNIPLIIYNVPSRTCCNVNSRTCKELSEIKNIAGIKEASGDLKQIAEIIRDCDKDFKVYSGNDGDTFAIVTLGGEGVISVASHIIGKEIKQMINFIKTGKIIEAADLHKKFLDIFYGIFITTNPIPIKKALNLKGINAGHLRPPLYEMDAKEEEAFNKLLLKYQIVK